ncbi:MAG: tetratricopeptide repeat protein, partial [Phycisphaerae bacterium]
LTEQEAHAIEVFRRVLTLAPDDWSAHSNLANLLAEHDAAAALDHARAAHRLRPDDLRVNMNLAESWAQNRRWEEALAQFRMIERRMRESAMTGDPLYAVVQRRIEELRRERLP